jgi:urocanate hydratase
MDAKSRDRQRDILRLYGRLIGEREDWGGALLLSCGEGSASSGIPAAGSIAGGATLVIDADASEVKGAMRRGELDFVVNTLDEALRTLKNQVRLRRPLSVGLVSNVATALAEATERGVLPDVLLIASTQCHEPILENGNIQALEAAGMAVRLMGDLDDERRCRSIMPSGGPYECHLLAESAEQLREIDRRLLELLPVEDRVRRRWVERVPNYLHEARRGGRWIWLTDKDRAQTDGWAQINRG